MAQFDVYRVTGEGLLIVDCQSELLASLPTRYAIPLYSRADAEWQFSRLTPQLEFQGKRYTLATPVGAAVDVDDLGKPVGSLALHRYTILNAIDFLLTGV